MSSAPVAAPARRRRLPTFTVGKGSELLPLLVALLVALIFFRIASPYFLTARNLTNLLVQVAPLAIIAIASTIVILMGEIDLSLGSIAGFTAALVAILLAREGMPWSVALMITLLAGVAVAGLQGLFVLVGRVRSFAVTLAGFFVWYGVQVGILGSDGQQPLRRPPLADLASERIATPVAMIVVGVGGVLLILARYWMHARDTHESRLSRGQLVGTSVAWVVALGAALWAISYLDDGGGIPLVFAMALALTGVVWLVLTRTAYGRHLYAVGGDAEASRAMGIAVGRVKWVAFAAAGAMAAFAGVVLVSFTGGADASTGAGAFMLQAIGAAVVGGVSLFGGRGSVWGAFGGAVLLAGVQNGLALLSLDFYVVDIALGLVVLAALLADSAIRRRLVSA
jgi:D-xylose transport system permease protein